MINLFRGNKIKFLSPLNAPRFLVAANLTAMLCVVGLSLVYGLQLRRWAWDASSEIHFRISLTNAIRWGQYTNKVGRLNVYQKLVDEFGGDGDFRALPGQLGLDYPPLRLFVISKWEAWTEQHFPVRKNRRAVWRSDYEFNRPMLWLNNACEIGGAVAMFLLVHYWLRHCARAGVPPPFLTAVWPALIAALLLWFNPAVIFNAHCFPQWDVWILPAFLLALYLGLQDQWLTAGVCIGVVAMGKGQILLVTPVLIIWQLCCRKPGAVVRLLIGILLATGLLASPWMVSNTAAYRWMKCTFAALAAMLALFYFRGWSKKSLLIHGGILIAAMTLVLWPWVTLPRPPYIGLTFAGLMGFAAAARFLARRWIPSWFAAGLTTALFANVPLFSTSMAWYTVGIAYSTRHWPLLYWCQAMNLGAILQKNYGWEWADNIDLADYFSFLHHPQVMPMRYLMLAAYTISLLLCGICLTVHHRRKNSALLFAMVAPWVLMFALLPQMQNRYLVWAAAFSAAPAAISLDGFMLYLLLAFISVIDTAVDMLGRASESSTAEHWLPIIGPMFPGMSWAVMLITAIWLYLAIRPMAVRSGLSQSNYPRQDSNL